MSKFGIRLKELRLAFELTQTELGEKLGYKRRMIQYLETGQREPNIETLEKLSNIFHCSIDYLLGKTDSDVDLVVNAYNHLPNEQKKIIDDLINSLLKSKDPQ